MTYAVGDLIRFEARFRNARRQAFDPREPYVVVTTGGHAVRYTERNGLQRDELGVYHIDVALISSGPGEVEFGGGELEGSATFEVLGSSSSLVPAAPAPDESQAQAMAMMLEDLAAEGMDLSGRSFGVVRGAHASMLERRATDRHADQREARASRGLEPLRPPRRR